MAVKEREKLQKFARKISASGRDIAGVMRPCGNKKRRKKCERDLKLFCETYFPDVFYYGWSPSHLKAIKKIEDSVFYKTLYAVAMPRGEGKTTLCRVAVIWASLYCHCKYIYFIGANSAKSIESLESIKLWLRFNELIVSDFPEVSIPFRAIEGIAQRANGQMINGVGTMLKYEKEKLVFPFVLDEKEKPYETSGIIISCSGLTGDGIRGSLHTTSEGKLVRPDLVIIDDPQTDESANSVSQNEKRYGLITGAVLGMAGAGKSIAGVMPCTVIQKGDMVDNVLNRNINPIWRGERYKMISALPENMGAWEKYFEKYIEIMEDDNLDNNLINDYYIENQKELEEGCVANWVERKLETDISAIQHAMHLYFRDREKFFSEYQNEPLDNNSKSRAKLSKEKVMKMINGYPVQTVPQQCNTVTAMIDVQLHCLFYVVMAFDDMARGYIIDYGTFPEQNRRYYSYKEIKNTIKKLYPNGDFESNLHKSLREQCDKLLQGYERDDGLLIRPKRILIDARWGQSTSTVYQFCRQYGRQEVIPSLGMFFGANTKPYSEYKRLKGEIIGNHWRFLRVKEQPIMRIDIDVNFWKSEFSNRMIQELNSMGSISLYKSNAKGHLMIAENFTSEEPFLVTGVARTVEEWRMKNKNRDNHFFDCAVGCIAVADSEGVKITGNVKQEVSQYQQKQRRQAKYL